MKNPRLQSEVHPMYHKDRKVGGQMLQLPIRFNHSHLIFGPVLYVSTLRVWAMATSEDHLRVRNFLVAEITVFQPHRVNLAFSMPLQSWTEKRQGWSQANDRETTRILAVSEPICDPDLLKVILTTSLVKFGCPESKQNTEIWSPSVKFHIYYRVIRS